MACVTKQQQQQQPTTNNNKKNKMKPITNQTPVEQLLRNWCYAEEVTLPFCREYFGWPRLYYTAIAAILKLPNQSESL